MSDSKKLLIIIEIAESLKSEDAAKLIRVVADRVALRDKLEVVRNADGKMIDIASEQGMIGRFCIEHPPELNH